MTWRQQRWRGHIIYVIAPVAAMLALDAAISSSYEGVAGLMVFISLDELLPAAREHGEAHLAIIGATVGMAVSLWLLRG